MKKLQSDKLTSLCNWCGVQSFIYLYLILASYICMMRLYRLHVYSSLLYSHLQCGPMPTVMVALPNLGGALCSTPQSLADAHYWMPCSNAAKTPNPLKFAGVPQTTGSISAASGPKFTILREHVEDILLLNKFFSDCRYMP